MEDFPKSKKSLCIVQIYMKQFVLNKSYEFPALVDKESTIDYQKLYLISPINILCNKIC